MLQYYGKLLKRIVGEGSLTVDELSSAQITIIKAVQWEYFSKEMSLMSALLKGSAMFLGPLEKLNDLCFSLLPVRGCLRRAPIEFKTRHPIILPSDSHVTKLLIEQHHWDVGHCVCLSLGLQYTKDFG